MIVRPTLGPPPAGDEIPARAFARVRTLLPPGWSLDVADGAATLTAPDGRTATLTYAVATNADARDVARLLHPDDDDPHRPGRQPAMLVARYINASIRERLGRARRPYADTTGNIRLTCDDPALALITQGAAADPWRGPGRPMAGLGGAPAGLVVRTLLDAPHPRRMTELIRESGTGTGSVYRVLDLLTLDGLVERGSDGLVRVLDPEAILRRWSSDSSGARTGRTSRWIAPRGIAHLLDTVRDRSALEHALTGSAAAREWVKDTPVRFASLYVTDPVAAAETWGLRPAETGVNVVLHEVPSSHVALRGVGRSPAGLHVAAPAQVAADMMTGPGREPAEVEALLAWMRTDGPWR